MNNFDFKKNGVTVLSVLSLIALFFPIIKMGVSVSVMGVSGESSNHLNGLDLAFGDDMLWLFMLITPAFYLVGAKLEALKKYEHILAVLLPIVSLLIMIKTRLFIGRYGMETGFVDVEFDYGLAGYLLFIFYAAMLYFNAAKFGYSLDISGAQQLKNNIEKAVKERKE